MRIWQIISCFALVIFLYGCATKSSVDPIDRIAFPVDEYQKLATTGTAVIKGQAFLRTRGGDVKTAAGYEIILNPVTSYSTQWFETTYTKGFPLKDPDPRMFQYIRTQIADGDGRFTFRDVPPGGYYITTVVYWDAVVGSALRPQGGTISEQITVKNGEEIEIVLTRK